MSQSCNSDGKVIYLQLRSVPVALLKTTEDGKSNGSNTIIIGDRSLGSNRSGISNLQNFQQLIKVNNESNILLSVPIENQKDYSTDPKEVEEQQNTIQDKTQDCDSGIQAFNESRTNTDVLWLFFFLILAFAWLCLGVYVGASSKTTSFFSTYSSYKEKCPSDDEKFLMYFDLANYFKNTRISSVTDLYIQSKFCPTRKVCVTECPTNIWTAELFLKHVLPFNQSLIQNNLICISDSIKKNITTLDVLEDVVNKNLCMKEYSYNVPVLNLCLPFKLLKNLLTTKFKWNVGINVVELIYLCILENGLYVQMMLTSSCLLMIIYVCLLYWIAAPSLWFSIIGFIVIAIAGFIYSTLGYFGIESNGSFKFYKIWFIKEGSILSLICVILAVILLLVVIKKVVDLIRLKDYIKPGLILITESCRILLQTKGSLFFIFLVIHIYFALAIWAWNVVICLMNVSIYDFEIQNQDNLPCNCTGEYQNAIVGNKCVPKNFTHFCSNCICSAPNVIKFYFVMVLRIFNVIAVIWTIIFIYAFSKMVLANSLCRWYYNVDKKELPPFLVISSTKIILRYHLGTAAYGSFGILKNVIYEIIAVVRMLPKLNHTIFPFKINMSSPMDKYSLIICAVNGTSLKNSTEKLNSNIIEDGGRKRLNKAIQKILNIIKWTIFLTLIILLYLIPHNKTYCKEIVLHLLCFCIYLISTLFIQVCQIVADSLIYCYVQDLNSKSNKINKLIPETLKRFFEKEECFTCEYCQGSSQNLGIHG